MRPVCRSYIRERVAVRYGRASEPDDGMPGGPNAPRDGGSAAGLRPQTDALTQPLLHPQSAPVRMGKVSTDTGCFEFYDIYSKI
jgi:hypothetical protein